MNKVIILQGCPASGKSTWAREFVKGKKDWVIVNRDSIREGRGDYWIPEQEDLISDYEEFQVRKALDRGYNVIIDATNLNPKTQKKWIDIAAEYAIVPEWKEFIISYKEALERDVNRSRPVGKKVLRDFFNRYYPDMICDRNDNRPIKQPDYNLQKVVICDIDGTIALRNDRSPFDNTKVGEDTFDPRMGQVLEMCIDAGVDIIFVSGREDINDCKLLTLNWLNKNFKYDDSHWDLYMRNEGDHRSDDIVKKEIYDKYIKDQYNVVCVFDDRDRVVKMWREEGLLCNQVYYGEF